MRVFYVLRQHLARRVYGAPQALIHRRLPVHIEVPILDHQQVGDAIYRLTLGSTVIADFAAPGQFVQLLYHGPHTPSMRRPFSIHDVDRHKGTFQIIYAARGTFTSGMTHLRAGESLSVVGPLGQSFKLFDDPITQHIAVAGGVGAPPLHFFMKRCAETDFGHNLTAIVGARTAGQLVVPEDFAALDIRLILATDDGSAGRKGTVLTILEDTVTNPIATAVYACGPEPMLRAVGTFCTERSIACRLSLETVMPCGTGVCMGCVVKVRSKAYSDGFEYVRACSEGPIFNAEDILWD